MSPTPPNNIDERLRQLLDAERNAPDQYGAHLELSRARNHPVIGQRNGGSRRRRWRPLAIAVPVAAALTAIAMLVPPLQDGGRTDRAVERLAPEASAAEVLEIAGNTILKDGGTVGEGDVWHGVSRTFHDGKLITVNEQWYSTTSDRNLLAAWGVGEDNDELLLLDRVDADGVHRIRTFERPKNSDRWGLPPDLQPTNAMDLPVGGSDRQRQLAIAVREWLAVAASPDVTTADLQRATRRYMSLTHDAFVEHPAPLRGSAPSPDEMHERFEQLRELDRVRQVLYLLTTVQATPTATAELYDVVGGFDSLERLTDVQIDGRPAMRIRFDPRDDSVTRHRERVLVLDLETGRLVRTETLDRTSWTEIEPARRVKEIGDARYLCRGDNSIPCELLEGRGETAAQGDQFAFNMAVRYTAHRINQKNRALGDEAPPLLCMKMSDVGECLPTSPGERARLEAIERDERALRDTFSFNNKSSRTTDDDAFATAKVLYRIPDEDGGIRPAGDCIRDWRWLAVCRG